MTYTRGACVRIRYATYASRYTYKVFLNPKDIFKHLPIHASARVGDFGTGAGHYALLAAEKLGQEGAVYVFDINGSVIDKVRKAGEQYPASFYGMAHDLNVSIPLKNDLLDVAVVANVLHQLERRGPFVKELARVLGRGGKALVVDWAASFNNIGPTKEKAIAAGEAARLFEEAGFTVGEMLPAGTHHFAFIAHNA